MCIVKWFLFYYFIHTQYMMDKFLEKLYNEAYHSVLNEWVYVCKRITRNKCIPVSRYDVNSKAEVRSSWSNNSSKCIFVNFGLRSTVFGRNNNNWLKVGYVSWLEVKGLRYLVRKNIFSNVLQHIKGFVDPRTDFRTL